jgi:hypothetical protein
MLENKHCTIGVNGSDRYFDDVRGKPVSRNVIPCDHRPACFTERQHERMCDADDRDCIIGSMYPSRAYDPGQCYREPVRRSSYRPSLPLYRSPVRSYVAPAQMAVPMAAPMAVPSYYNPYAPVGPISYV